MTVDMFPHLENTELSAYLNGPADAGSYQQLCDFVRYTKGCWWEDTSNDYLDETILDGRRDALVVADQALEIGDFPAVHKYLRLYWSI